MIEVRCCVCGKLRVGNTWIVSPAERKENPVSHGYCPSCAQEATEGFRLARHARPAVEQRA